MLPPVREEGPLLVPLFGDPRQDLTLLKGENSLNLFCGRHSLSVSSSYTGDVVAGIEFLGGVPRPWP